MKSRRKAAVFIINSLQNGGAERVVVNMATRLDEIGIRVFIIVIHKKQFYDIPNTIEVINIGTESHGIKKVLNIFPLSRKLSRILKSINKKYDVVLNTAHLPYTHIICRFSQFNSEIMYVMHNPQFQFKHSNTLFFKWKIKFLYFGKKVIAVSEGVRDELLKVYKLKSKDVKTIYNPINVNEIDRKLSEHETKIPTFPYVLAAGRLNEQKRYDRLLYAYKKSRLCDSYKLVILGIGEEKEKLESIILDQHLQDKVLLPGWSNNVYQWMKNAKLFVSSSDYESFGMTILEALYCGCKVVSTDCKYGPNEIMTGKLSKYLSALNSSDLANKMDLAIEKYPRVSGDIFSKFRVENIMKQYLKCYQDNIRK